MTLLNAPIFLLCSERSGSNLIAKIFDAHRNVSAPGPAHLFRVMSECANSFHLGSADLRSGVLDLFDAKVSRWAIDAWLPEKRAALLEKMKSAAEMAAALYTAEATIAGKDHVFTKENSSFKYLPMLLGQSSRPRFLFMTRDPRDMAVSWAKGAVMRGGVLRAAERWLDDQTGYLQAISQLPTNTRIATLRYEDLLIKPERELRRVCLELELNFDSKMLAFSQKSTGARSDAKQTSMWSNLDKPLLSKNSNKFLNELTDDAIAYIEVTCGHLMDVMKYTSVRERKNAFGQFNTLEDLHTSLVKTELYDKPAYQDLPHDERTRFENWSRQYAKMRARKPLNPATLLGHTQ